MARLAYIRVSTDPQHTDRQEAIIAKYEPDEIFVEKASGKNTDRPKLQAMLKYMRKGDTVYIESYSRLGRSTHDLLNLFQTFTEKGVSLVSEKENLDTSTPHGKLMMTIFASLAEFERDLTLIRVREGIEAARRRGKLGGRPRIPMPEDMRPVMRLQEAGTFTVAEACKRLGLSRSKYFELKAEYKNLYIKKQDPDQD